MPRKKNPVGERLKEEEARVYQGINEIANQVNNLVNQGANLVITTIKLSRNVWLAAKHRALNEGIKLSQMVEAALRKYLELEE
jgi:hypothetical protein